jgi:hypothetical protein
MTLDVTAAHFLQAYAAEGRRRDAGAVVVAESARLPDPSGGCGDARRACGSQSRNCPTIALRCFV